MPSTAGPTVLDALALLGEVADELVLAGVRETHLAWADRVESVTGSHPVGRLHRGVSSAVYGGLGMGLRAVAGGLDAVATSGRPLDAGPGGRSTRAVVNGLIGDRLQRERPRLAIDLAVRHEGRDVALDRAGLAAAFPEATGRVVVFLHGLCEHEGHWSRNRDRTGATYAETLAAQGWTPVLLRANTGLPLREGGVALASLLEDLTASWPTEVTRLVLVGHSMGGLIIRAAGAVAAAGGERPAWTELVTDVVTLGTPHLGAPVARGVGHGSRQLARLPETAAIGRILDWRSAGVHDLVAGLDDDVVPLPHAQHRLVVGTLTTSARHPLAHLLGDLMVSTRSGVGRNRAGRNLFPDGEVLHVGRAGHLALLNHPDVHAALVRWLE